MKKLRNIAIVLLSIILVVSCASTPKVRIEGTANHNTRYLENGKTAEVAIFAINDFHGSVEEDLAGKNPGIAKLYEKIKELEEKYPASLLLSAGDNYQGSALSNLSKGRIVSEFFRLADLDASTVGNHEFDWTDEHFTTWRSNGGFPFLAANLIDKRTGKLPTWCDEYALFNVGGHLIAIVGLATPETTQSAKADLIANYEFLDPATTARKVIRKIEAQFQPEAIIILSHLGTRENRLEEGMVISAGVESYVEELAKISGIDAIITGHSHMYVNGKSNEVPVLQAMNYGRGISKLVLKFSEYGLVDIKQEVVDVAVEKALITPDSKADAIVAKYNREYGAMLGETLAVIDKFLDHEETTPNVTPMGFVICSILNDHYGTDMAIMNGGGIRKSFNPGAITVSDMWDLLPFDNTAVIVTVLGRDLKKIIDHGINSVGFRAGQFAGGTVYYSTQNPPGERVIEIILDDGRVVEDDKPYTFVTNDFVYEGGDLYLMIEPSAIEAENTYEPIREVINDELRNRKDKYFAVPDEVNVLVAR